MQIKNRGIIILTLGCLSAIGPFSIDMYLPGFPAMARDLHTTVPHIELSLTSFFIGISIGQLIYGPLIDRFGRKGPLYTGLVVYLLTSAGCVFAPSADSLIGLRFLQATGSCAGMVVSRAMVRDIFPVHENARIFSMLMLVIGVSPIVAPTAGGYLSATLGWQSIFVVLFLIALLTLFLSFRFLPESRGPDTSMSLLPKKILGEFWEVLRNPQFILFVMASAISSAGLFAYISGSSYVFIEYFGINEKQFGWLFAFNAAGLIIASQVNRFWLAYRSSEGIVSMVSSVQAIAGLLLFFLTYFGIIGMPGIVGFLFIYLAMQGFMFPNTSALTLAPFTRRTGIASSLMGCVQMFFSALASGAVSFFHNETPVPMTAVIAVCGLFSFMFIMLALRRRHVSYLY